MACDVATTRGRSDLTARIGAMDSDGAKDAVSRLYQELIDWLNGLNVPQERCLLQPLILISSLHSSSLECMSFYIHFTVIYSRPIGFIITAKHL